MLRNDTPLDICGKMYGFIHCALEDLLVLKFGRETWEKVLKKSGVRLRGGSFLIHKVYGDDVTMKLVKATAEVLGLNVDACLEAFGQHFLTFCRKNGYEKILRVLGSNLEDFLTNLDNLHDHLAATYPGMRAPSFRTTPSPDGSLLLHYYSERKGLQAIVQGLVKVVAKEFFNAEVTVETKEIGDRSQRSYAVFSIRQKRVAHCPVTRLPSLTATSSGGWITNSPKDLPIDVKSFSIAFPFHVMFQRDFVITQAGKSLLRVTRSLWRSQMKSVRFTDLFQMCRPVIDNTFDAILDHKNTVFVVRFKDGVMSESTSTTCLRLKGQMMWVPETDHLLFLCSPRVSGIEEMQQAGVYFSDFPVHDRGRDLVLVGHHRRGERELVEKLDEASNHLKVLDTKLRDDKKRTEELLQSIFPGHVATKLCQSLPVEAERFELVTCLFSDIVGFTALCGTATPIDVVRLLNRLYLHFDNLISLHDVYKVETIGDAYVVVAGVPKFVANHADRVIDMALAMVEVTRYVTSPVDGMPIEIRVGVHSGSVVAGVLGVKMPRYCLLGNTVTLANQMESRSKPGKVTISDSTKRCLTQEMYDFEENPETSDLAVTGVFVTRIPREGDSGDMAALTVSSGGGGMFRSPTNSPGHSDEVTNDSNSPSLQSPSPHLTFKGMMCIPHIQVHAQPSIRSPPTTGSSSFRHKEMGRIFVFPPSPCGLNIMKHQNDGLSVPRPPPSSAPVANSSSEIDHFPNRPKSATVLGSKVPMFFDSRNGNEPSVTIPKTQDESVTDQCHTTSGFSSLPEGPEPSAKAPALQPIPSCRKRLKKAMMRNRRWSRRKLAPSETMKDSQTLIQSWGDHKSHRTRMSLRRMLSCGEKEQTKCPFEDNSNSQVDTLCSSNTHDGLSAEAKTKKHRYISSQIHRSLHFSAEFRRTTRGIISKIKMTTMF